MGKVQALDVIVRPAIPQMLKFGQTQPLLPHLKMGMIIVLSS